MKDNAGFPALAPGIVCGNHGVAFRKLVILRVFVKFIFVNLLSFPDNVSEIQVKQIKLDSK